MAYCVPRFDGSGPVGADMSGACNTRGKADRFVVMAIRHGEPPAVAARGEGPDASVKVGEQEVRFDGNRLSLKNG